jgi:iron(III) transport system substrate-binding protein
LFKEERVNRIIALVVLLLTGLTGSGRELVVYSARSRSLVDPIIRSFEQATGIRVLVRYGTNAELVAQLLEEGERTRADVFWGYESSLGTLAQRGLLDVLPPELLEPLAPSHRPADGAWAPISLRVRTLAYSPHRVHPEELPRSVLDLVHPRWRGRVGWAPSNAGFQTFVTGMRRLMGEEATLSWLREMVENQTKSYPNNTALLQAIAAGEIDLALVNHYYLYRLRAADPDFPVNQVALAPGDPGNLVLATGIGILRSARNRDAALAFVGYMLSSEGQAYFTWETYEFPAVRGMSPRPELAQLAADLPVLAPPVDLGALADLPGTLELLRRAGVL